MLCSNYLSYADIGEIPAYTTDFLRILHFFTALGYKYGMKRIWQSALMFHCFVTFPAALIFLIYSVGAMVLLLQWQLFLLGIALFIFGAFMMTVLAIMGE